MLIEWNKLNFRQRDNNLSHLYTMFTVYWDRDADQPTGKVCYRGAVSLSKLKSGVQKTVILRKGTVLPGTKTHLQADNYGIQFKDLYKQLNHMAECLLKSPPPQSMTDNYVIPILGKQHLNCMGKHGYKIVFRKQRMLDIRSIKEFFLGSFLGLSHYSRSPKNKHKGNYER